MKYSIIVAVGKNGEIGKNNDLLWHLPNDMRFFKQTTEGHAVIMGRKNWESIPEKYRPLSNRNNIVLTQNSNYEVPGAEKIHSLKDLKSLDISNGKDKIFIIGGAQVYKLALEELTITELFVTHVNSHFEADTFFPELNWNDWQNETILTQEQDQRHPYSFEVKRYWK